MERRASTSSHSSGGEPMEISSSTNKTSGVNSSTLRTDSESDEEYKEGPQIRRANMRQIMDDLMKRYLPESKHPNHNNNYASGGKSPTGSHGTSSTTPPLLDTSGNNNTYVKYLCPLCESITTTPSEFTAHIRSHNNDLSDDNQNFTCRICSKILSSASSLDRHVLVHTGERPFTCKYCNLTFTTNGNMHRHMRTHKLADRDNYESDASSDSARSYGSTSSNNNNVNHRGVKRKSLSADEEPPRNARKIKTINNNNILPIGGGVAKPQMFCCPVCIRNDFPTMLSLEDHMDQEHPRIPAKCRHCEIIFKSHKALNAHRCGSVEEHHPTVTQGLKNLTFVDFSVDKFPTIAKAFCEQGIRATITSQKFECSKCFRAFPSTTTMQMHQRNCEAESPQNYSMKRRRTTSETSEEEDIRRDDYFANLDLQNKSLSTSGISEPSSTPSSMEKSFPISYSSSGGSGSVKKELSFNQHDTKDLADIQSIINVTKSSGDFWKQLDKSEKEPISFGKDDEEAQDAFTAEFRKMKMKGEFPCKLCTAVFPNLRALKGHNRVHLSAAGPGPYKCNMCFFSINDKAALIRHMRTHNGDRPYECAICNYAFTTKANCERHLRNRHGKNTRDEIKRAIIYHPSEDSSCDDPVKKMQMFTTPETVGVKREEPPQDRSTPVSHLREILLPKTPKIQVRSLDKLTESPPSAPSLHKIETPIEHPRPMDLSSSDVLDLSKKSSSNEDESRCPEEVEEPEEEVKTEKIDMSMFEKNQQLLLLQQQFLSETLPKINPAHYFQLLYRNFGFHSAFPLHPLLFPNPLLNQTPEMPDMKKFLPPPSMSGGSLIINPYASPSSPKPTSVPIEPPIAIEPLKVSPQKPIPTAPPMPAELPSSPVAPKPQSVPPTSPGPVKMVIKNGVLMPKQKQRRYRTERPFACEHCSARFTLRSNMERHIKQQHPQFWAARQRGAGPHMIRRGPPVVSSIASAPIMPQFPPSTTHSFNAISDQVKYAILAQQLKSRDNSSMILQSALSQHPPVTPQSSTATANTRVTEPSGITPNANSNDDDEPKLVIDEESEPENLCSKPDSEPVAESHILAKKIAENILEQARQTAVTKPELVEPKVALVKQEEKTPTPPPPSFPAAMDNGHNSGKEEDLVSVSKLVDNATNAMSFGNYFKSQESSQIEHSDEEGLVASGSTSESNNSGTDDPKEPREEKKRSAYSMAPNRVSCPYCQRMFPWSSSLRRHILTHTGQKPFKCSHCPLLFTTKSNCDRHLARKHGDVESAMSVPVPIDEMPEPEKVPVNQAASIQPPKDGTVANLSEVPVAAPTFNIPAMLQIPLPRIAETSPPLNASELPFKCHLCDTSFADRMHCLEHIKVAHPQDFALLMAKVTLENEGSEVQTASPDDDEGAESRGKYPDYTNRKVICAFCMRRFWSTEDLRRHMRTHSGERPFQCDVCLRRFTLKHSMLRHRKKHAGKGVTSNNSTGNSASDMESDEESSIPPPSSQVKTTKIPELISRDLLWKLAAAQRESNNEERHEGAEDNSDLIGNLLGISDRGILNKLLSSPDEAAKLLGVKNNE